MAAPPPRIESIFGPAIFVFGVKHGANRCVATPGGGGIAVPPIRGALRTNQEDPGGDIGGRCGGEYGLGLGFGLDVGLGLKLRLKV